ncbi:DUF1574 family protein [Leptospira neocaledonica]|uniref:DUF1574 domain-containing protein n=1 Tax=Leptospira neocaledonica TaxID=2023192 RepID=A0A2M9ZVA9_9LEPT|nr:DUF1574 family protein [Leptospira neocaledonica]PJZ76016.1 hypothetical protein CH365_16775 [Leptospira neocaledonica]
MKKYAIQIFFILYFLLDKLVLIPGVKYFLTDSLKSNPYQETLDNSDPKEAGMIPVEGKKIVWAFGSSRSLSFYHMPNSLHTKVDRFTDSREKSLVDSYEFFAFASPGSNPVVFFTRVTELLERNMRPDVLFIETSAFGFNKNNRYTKYAKLEAIPFSFVYNHLDSIPYEYIYDITTTRLFATLRYRISRKAIEENLSGKAKAQEAMLRLVTKNFDNELSDTFSKKSKEAPRVYTEKEFKDFSPLDPESDELKLKIAISKKALEKEFYNAFEQDEAIWKFMEETLKKAKERKIPVVLWIPKVHPELEKIHKKYKLEIIWKERLKNLANRYDTILVDFESDEKLKCERFSDISHLSPICYTELSSVLLQKSSKN